MHNLFLKKRKKRKLIFKATPKRIKFILLLHLKLYSKFHMPWKNTEGYFGMLTTLYAKLLEQNANISGYQ